ncbi:MAG: anti-sigma factor antagonist [Cytophagales bacterium]|nr:MAG: anti-sigma factor antagonist [Cytophagales bacterium]
MELKVSNEEKFHIIQIIGDLDASSSILLDNALEEAITTNTKSILIDCAELHYISSPGIGAFTSRLEECIEKNIIMVLFGLNDKIVNVFRILGLDQLIVIKISKDDAKDYINDAQFTSALH